MHPDKNFKMSKTTKRMIAMMRGTDADRALFKRMMIDSQLAAESARRSSLKTKPSAVDVE